MITRKKVRDSVLGLAVGDAMGVPVEFVQRNLLKANPVTAMTFGGTHGQATGTWSDDTSLTIAMLDGLAETKEDMPDYDIIMRNFLSWLSEARYTAGDRVFDIGKCCFEAIARFHAGTDPVECGGKSEFECGNGALMRILPAVLYCSSVFGEDFFDNCIARELIYDMTSLTHGHDVCAMASGIYAAAAGEILRGKKDKKTALLTGIEKAKLLYEKAFGFSEELEKFTRMFNGTLFDSSEDTIKSSGYVVDTLEAALWCFYNTDSYSECILRAVNLGDDTDSVAAVAGSLAGMYYGSNYKDNPEIAIPAKWQGQLLRKEMIFDICDRFCDRYHIK